RGVRGRRAGGARVQEEGGGRHRLPAARGGASAAARLRRRVSDRLPASGGPRRHPDPHRSAPYCLARRARRASREAGRRHPDRARHPRHRRDRRARIAPAVGSQGSPRQGRAHGGAVLKAALFREHGGAEKILYDDYRDPAIGPGDVLVRVRACALNQVDMLLLDGRFPPPEGLPHVNGCEVTGTVEATGDGVRGLARGQRVIVFPGFSCGTCEYCLRGERTVCVRYGYLGAAKDGGYAEYVKTAAENIIALPDGLDLENAAAAAMRTLTS